MTRIGASALSLLAVGVLSSCVHGSGVPTGDATDAADAARTEKVAFSSSRDGDFEIYVMNPDGSAVRQLTHNRATEATNAEDDNPVWAPDGRKILFTSTRDHPSGGVETEEIYVMDADGSHETRLTKNDSPDLGPRWTSDRQIVFTSCRGNGLIGCELVTMKIDGSGRRTADVDAALVYGYAPSPDGSKVAFTWAEGGIEARIAGANTDVYVMDADGGDPRRLTESKARDGGAAWSPDGRLLAFTSDRDRNGECLWHDCVGYNPEVYVMRADGSDERRLTDDPGDDGVPQWSPDGSRLLFSAYRGGNDYELYVMNADGSCVTQLTRNSKWDWSPDWYWPPERESTGRLRC